MNNLKACVAVALWGACIWALIMAVASPPDYVSSGNADINNRLTVTAEVD